MFHENLIDGREYGPEGVIPVSLPPRVLDLIENPDMFPPDVRDWIQDHVYPYPALNVAVSPLNSQEIQNHQVDAVQLFQSFSDFPELKSSIRTGDIEVGCNNQCPTCYMDAPFTSSRFSAESWSELLQQNWFIRMLQSDSFRIGSSGDPLSHPDGVEMIKNLLTATKGLDENQKLFGDRHVVRVLSNFRPKISNQIIDLIELAKKEPNRIDLVISIPNPLNNTISQQFENFVGDHLGYFQTRSWDSKSFRQSLLKTIFPNVHVVQIDDPVLIGRIPEKAKDLYWKRYTKHYHGALNPNDFSHRGLTKVILNPDGLWLVIYCTSLDSRTSKIFIPMISDMVPYLSQFPWHGDFPKPPNWRGDLVYPDDPFVAAWNMPYIDELQPKPLHII